MKKIKISVIIISFNRKEMLKLTLNNTLKQNFTDFEVIVVDNSSSDGTKEMIESEFPEVKLIKIDKNIGIEAYNVGIDSAKGEIIVFLDDDSFLETEALSKIARKFDKYSNLGALGCKVKNYYSGEVHHWHPKIKLESGPEEGYHSPLFNGCAAAARKNVLEKVGAYPKEFFLYENERDLCTRIIDAGYDVRYFTDIIGYHMVPSGGRESDRLIFFSNRNRLWYYWKYLPFFPALRYTLSAIKMNFINAVKERKPAYLKSVFSAFGSIFQIIRGRKRVKKENIEKILY